ncbi:MAG: CrcB family protein [Planctomycetota bacterium]|nr:CrcB family protein [Planctomycetota bacterium]
MNATRRALLVAGGAALGGLFRVVLTALLPVAAQDPMLVAPALLVVNVSGSLLAGFIRRLAGDEERKGRDPSGLDPSALEATMVVGFCGGYTSYSAFVGLLHEGLVDHMPWTIGLAAATIVLCPLAAALGMRASARSDGGYPPNPAGKSGQGSTPGSTPGSTRASA